MAVGTVLLIVSYGFVVTRAHKVRDFWEVQNVQKQTWNTPEKLHELTQHHTHDTVLLSLLLVIIML